MRASNKVVSLAFALVLLVVQACGSPESEGVVTPASALGSVYEDSICDGHANWAPFLSFLSNTTEWVRVTGVDDDTASFEPGLPGSVDWVAASVAGVQDLDAESANMTVETSADLSSAVASASLSTELDVYVALGHDPVNPENTPVRPIFGIATDGEDFAFLGMCAADLTDHVYRTLADRSVEFVNLVVGRPGADAVSAFNSLLPIAVPSSTIAADLPQYLPGLDEPSGVDPSVLQHHTVSVVWTPIARGESGPGRMCVGSEDLLGTCWSDVGGLLAEGNRMKIDAEAWIEPGRALLLYQANTITEDPLVEFHRFFSEQLTVGGKIVVMLDSNSDGYEVAEIDTCTEGDDACGPGLVSSPRVSAYPSSTSPTSAP